EVEGIDADPAPADRRRRARDALKAPSAIEVPRDEPRLPAAGSLVVGGEPVARVADLVDRLHVPCGHVLVHPAAALGVLPKDFGVPAQAGAGRDEEGRAGSPPLAQPARPGVQGARGLRGVNLLEPPPPARAGAPPTGPGPPGGWRQCARAL